MRKAFRLSAPAKLDVDELVLRIAEDDWQTAPTTTSAASGTSTPYFHDGVTSVTALADHTGAIQQTYEYSPFGRDRASTGSTPNRLKYTGREQDPSGLYYYRARYYDPETRRFLSEDPLCLCREQSASIQRSDGTYH
jgi:RHS repeat-associated protein